MTEPNNSNQPVVLIPVLHSDTNLPGVVQGILSQKLGMDVLLIPTSSAGNGCECASALSLKYPNVSCIPGNANNREFGQALGLGFEAALMGGYDPIITMNEDASHDATYLQTFIDASEEYDLVIGSRYINGVRVEGLKFRRLFFDKLANMIISYVMVKPIWDFTSGYRCYRREFLSIINRADIPSTGFLAQIQLLHMAFQRQFRVKEIPIIYRGRGSGPSNDNKYQKIKALFCSLKFRAPILEIFRHLTYLKKDYKRFVEEYEELICPPKLKRDRECLLKDKYSISIGVLAYNEEKIIGKCLNGLMDQQLKTGSIDEIIVISSGSTDLTNHIVREYTKKDNRIKLVAEPCRSGKACAINEFLNIAKGDIAVIESADTVPQPDTIEELVKPFSSACIGMTGARPIPANSKKCFMDFCVHKLWQLHHHLAMDSPKCGEIVAFRNIIMKIPKYTAVDEAAIESIFTREGFELAYAPNAIVHNKGPETLKDFISQRRRIASGHIHLQAAMGYKVATARPQNIWHYVLKCQRWSFKEVLYMAALIMVEGYSRFMGRIDYYLKDKNPYIWDIADSTKRMD